MKTKIMQRLLAVFVVLCMVAVWAVPTSATETKNFWQVDNDRVSASVNGRDPVDVTEEEKYAPTDVVRVSIVMDKAGALEAGFDAEDIAKNDDAMNYRNELKKAQDAMVDKINLKLGCELDVKWNLTLAANLISANVAYGQIKDIKAMDGVKTVVIETAYEPDVVSKGGDDPDMTTSALQIGSAPAYAAGLTGAGSRIAIIDTGLDINHISYDPGAFIYSLTKRAEELGVDPDDYIESLDLLNAADIAAVLPYTNLGSWIGASTENADQYAAWLNFNEKVPFGFNYVDRNLNIEHIYDVEGEHGSHVAGIAAANAYVPAYDGYAKAIDSVLTQGVAPDAQLMVMKVFGQNGGAYDSDYMAAIEDAIILGADSVNLSLGSGSPGFTTNEDEYFQGILDKLVGCGVVVSFSAGNSGSWVDNSESGMPYLYADDVSMHMSGNPGAFTNAFNVASVDNYGMTSSYFEVNGTKFVYTESTDYGNAPMANIAGTYEYVFLNNIGTAEQFAALGVDLTGKVVLCYRGQSSFFEKANAAVELGAKAVIIVNNEPGIIGLNLSGYKYTAPVVSILQAEGEYFKSGTPITGDGVEGWTGIMKIDLGVMEGTNGYYTMSDFSSWGVPGDLTIKPEITAPGGNIYSVAGAWNDGTKIVFGDNQSYELMSGTSMASPQVAGMAAVLAQYIRENDLVTKTGLDARTLAQSLLMSTAEPITDKKDCYYSIMQQGAGLANIGNAVTATSYILMDPDATASWKDGKVKAELGDDPARTGVYTFSFTINNLSGSEETYALAADMFTQYFTFDQDYNAYMKPETMDVQSTTVWAVNDEVIDDTFVTVPADGNVKVTATITLDPVTVNDLLQNLYNKGFYVEGYVYAMAVDDLGAIGTTHSIPVLGFCGNWTDPSMFDKVSFENYFLSGEEDRTPYLYESNFKNGNFNGLFLSYGNEPGSLYYFGGNPYVKEVYKPERNAISAANGDMIDSIGFTAIRNAAAAYLLIPDSETGTPSLRPVATQLGAAYYAASRGSWTNTYYTVDTRFCPTMLPEGTSFEMGVILIPEYYAVYDSNELVGLDISTLGEGAYFTMGMTVDNTAPVVNDVLISDMNNKLIINATDNEYVAAVAVFDSLGQYRYTITGSKDDAVAGGTYDFELDLAEINGNGFLIQVYDYAGNTTTYELDMELGNVTDETESVEVTPETMIMQKGETKSVSAVVYPVNARDRSFTWSSSNEEVAIVDENGNVLAVGVGTAEIIATSVADPTVSGSCAVEVIEIDKTLNAIVWSDVLEFVEFNTTTMPDFEALSPDMYEITTLGAAAVGPDDVIYICSFNGGKGYMYTLNPETWELNELAACIAGPHIFYSDLTYAPTLFGTGWLLGSYDSMLFAIDPASGETIGYIDKYDKPIVGVASLSSGYAGNGMYMDEIALIHNDGSVTIECYVTTADMSLVPYYYDKLGGYLRFDTGVSVGNSWYLNSAHYDGEYLYWAAWDINGAPVTNLYAIDLESETTFWLGNFGEGNYPVAGLFELPCMHKNTEVRDASDTSCEGPGYTGDTYCTDCGKLIKKGEEVPALDHKFGEWYEVEAPKCEATGTERRDCANCDHFETRTTDAPGHTMGEWYEYKHPNCVEKGEARSECQYCDYYESIETATNDEHIMGEWTLTTVPTCTTEGEETRVCTREGCDHTETRPVEKDPNNHDMSDWTVTTKPGCETEGEETRTCKREGCDHTETRKVDATNHAMGEWELTTKPTCDTEGEETRKCTNEGCDHTETRKVDATDHAMGEWELTTKPGCDTDGEETRKCTNEGCNHTETRKVDATGHNYIESTNDKGETVHTCEHCNDSYVVSVPPTGESFDLRVVMAVAVVAAAAVVVLMVYRKKFNRA